jgi:collagenase-like PrtC family protease/chorismate mutase
MIEITMPTSFEPALLDGLTQLNERHAAGGLRVTELFGSLPRSAMGVGRPTRSLPDVDRDSVAAHVADLRRRGFSFSYLFNGSCSANREFRGAERRRLLEEMAWVESLGTRSVVVASPYLIQLFRTHFPALRVNVSSVAFARSLKEVAHLVRQGVARLVLDPDTIRDFGFVRAVRERFPALEVEALANHPCLLHCPFETYCYNSVAHASADDGAGAGAAYECYSLLRCNLEKLRDPVEFVRGSWLRPQDVHHFEQAGVHVLKLAGRGRSTEWLLRAAGAYLSRSFDGNLMDLVWEAQWAAVLRSVPGAADLPPLELRVDAAAFDGFLDLFARGRTACRDGCDGCGICPSFARRGVRWNEEARVALVQALEAAVAGLLAPPAASPARASGNGHGRLGDLREAVDAIDDDLFELLARRAEQVVEIRRAKHAAGLPVDDPAREAEILTRLRHRHGSGRLGTTGVERVFRTVRDACAE